MKPENEGQNNEIHSPVSDLSNGSEQGPRPVILVFSDFYLPGYKSGGGMRTLVNIVDRFGDVYDFRIVTRDHDGKTDKTVYSDIVYDSWIEVGKARVRYLSKDQIRISEIKRIAQIIKPDAIFFNSFFSTLTIFVLLLRRLRMLKNIPLIIAPQGELADGGLDLKRSKKQAFLRVASKLGLNRDIVWRTTSDIERSEVENVKGSGGKVFVAPDLPPMAIFPEYVPAQRLAKKKGSVRLVYLSRIHPKKNAVFLLELLAEVRGRVQLDIIGPVDAADDYVQKCENLIAALPSNITVNLVGGVPHEKIYQTLVGHDFFILPTLAENFGHVFLEAMSAGCPLIISDRTPWNDLESKGIGWDIPLEDRAKWIDVLARCVDMNEETFAEMSAKARSFAEDWVADSSVETANRDVFDYALSLRTGV